MRICADHKVVPAGDVANHHVNTSQVSDVGHVMGAATVVRVAAHVNYEHTVLHHATFFFDRYQTFGQAMWCMDGCTIIVGMQGQPRMRWLFINQTHLAKLFHAVLTAINR